MKLNEEQTKKLRKFFDTHLSPPPDCPVCGQKHWAANDRVYEARDYLGGGISVGEGRVMPFILVICQDCGYTMWFNAVAAGILESEKGKKSESQKD